MIYRVKYRRQQRAQQRQRGITLIIGLMLLIMLTVVGLIGYRNTTLSERMSSGVRDRNLSFQAAESAGQEAINKILLSGITAGDTGYFANPLPNGAKADYWTSGAGPTVANVVDCAAQVSFSWKNCAYSVSTKYAGNAATTSFVIELLSSVTGTFALPAPSVGNVTKSFDTYRLTTRSTGASDNSDVVLQSIFTKETSIP